ncbi:hypothetical protein DIPPA_03612 [Diplonema papillatum]|nr:hypothetical protein DIPPA_03612 [Diplonema papillatum]
MDAKNGSQKPPAGCQRGAVDYKIGHSCTCPSCRSQPAAELKKTCEEAAKQAHREGGPKGGAKGEDASYGAVAAAGEPSSSAG